jgi:hypothetical protein
MQLTCFLSGIDGMLTGTFFRNQTFPENWHRRGTAGTLNQVIEYLGIISRVCLELVPGANDDQGVFKPDDTTAEVNALHSSFRVSDGDDVACPAPSRSSTPASTRTTLQLSYIA